MSNHHPFHHSTATASHQSELNTCEKVNKTKKKNTFSWTVWLSQGWHTDCKDKRIALNPNWEETRDARGNHTLYTERPQLASRFEPGTTPAALIPKKKISVTVSSIWDMFSYLSDADPQRQNRELEREASSKQTCSSNSADDGGLHVLFAFPDWKPLICLNYIKAIIVWERAPCCLWTQLPPCDAGLAVAAQYPLVPWQIVQPVQVNTNAWARLKAGRKQTLCVFH